MRAWLTALRIARRETRRAKGRSALVVALIGLPVLAFTFFAVTYDTFTLTLPERADRELGRADLYLTDLYDGPVRQHPTGWGLSAPHPPLDLTADAATALLPPGTRIIPIVEGSASFRTTHGRGPMQTRELDYTDPLATGIMHPLAGRAPAGPDEVALTPKARKRVGAGIGGTLAAADGSRTWRIVGLVEHPQALGIELAVFRPGGSPAAVSEPVATWLADTPSPMRWTDVVELNKRGAVARSRAVFLDPPPYDPATMPPATDDGRDVFALGTVFGGVLVLEVVLLAGPAFAVGARRRRRDLALVAAAGGSPSHLRRIVLADGVILGSVAAVLGLVSGVFVAFAGRPLVEQYLMLTRPGAFRVFPAALAGLALLAVTAGVLAALVPAWTAARQPVVAALSGRYATTRLRRRWAVLGLAVLAAGVSVTGYGASIADETLTMAGMVIGEIGLVLCTPALVGLVARLGGRLPLSARIALRDVSRNRAAAAPAISAVLAAVAVSTLAAVMIAGNAGRYGRTDRPTMTADGAVSAVLNQFAFGHGPSSDAEPLTEPPATAFPALAAAMRATMPVTATVPVGRVVCGTDASPDCVLGVERPEPNRCPYATVQDLTREQRRAARRDGRCETLQRESYGPALSQTVIDPADLGTLVHLDAATLATATVTLRAGGILVADPYTVAGGEATTEIYDGDGEPRKMRLPAMALPPVDSPQLVISAAGVARLGLASRPAGFVGITDRMPTQAEEDAFLAAAAKVEGSWQIGVQKHPTPESKPFLIVLAIAAGIVTIGAAGIAAGLAAAEGRADLTTLAAVGASPGVRRTLSLSRTGIVAGLGSVLGLLAGLGAAAAVVAGTNQAVADVWPVLEPPMPFILPWLNIGISLVVVPMAAMLGAGLFTRARLPVERSA